MSHRSVPSRILPGPPFSVHLVPLWCCWMPWSTCGRGRGLGPPSPRRHPSNGRTPGPSVGSQRWRWRSMVPWLVSFFKFFFFRYFPAIPEKRMTGQWFNMSICIKLCNIIYIVHTHFFFYSKNSEQMIC